MTVRRIRFTYLTRRFFNCPSISLCFLIVFLLGLMPTIAQAQSSGGSGQDIQNATTSILGKTHNLVNTIGNLCDATCQASNSGKMFKAKVDQMTAAQTRAENANKRATPDDYDKVNRRKSKNKHDDGCDPNVQICVASTSGAVTVSSSSNEPEVDDSTGQDVAANLNDVGSDIDQLNLVLSSNVPPPPPITVNPLTDAEYFFPTSMWPSPTVVYAAFLANQAAEKVAELANPPCDETLVALGEGGNGALACLATEGIYMVVNYTYEIMEFIVRERANAEITGAYKRAGDLYSNLKSSSEAIGYIEQRVKEIEDKEAIILSNQQCIMQLLTMPQGQRPGFPAGAGACGIIGSTR
jgi:hypothetical protein